MKLKMNFPLVLCVCFFVVASATSIEKLQSDEFIEEINNAQSSWKAGKNFQMKTLLRRMKNGLVESPSDKWPIPMKYIDIVPNLPETFDAREQWPECKSIKQIRDQSNCASCWAVSATEVMSDRICIHSNATKQVTISAKNLISCCEYCGFGCNGGIFGNSWKYWKEFGIVTGGEYGSNEGCQTYMLPPCEFNVTKGSHPPCPPGEAKTPACVKQCDENSGLNYDEELYFGKEVYLIHATELEMMSEIYTNGPIQTYIDVYDDWVTYKSGVYRHVTGNWFINHMVKIVGWGVENNEPYWLIANSFSEDWGDKGYFKILRGSNECNIEKTVCAGIPKL